MWDFLKGYRHKILGTAIVEQIDKNANRNSKKSQKRKNDGQEELESKIIEVKLNKKTVITDNEARFDPHYNWTSY